jgi:hypothetical protein
MRGPSGVPVLFQSDGVERETQRWRTCDMLRGNGDKVSASSPERRAIGRKRRVAPDTDGVRKTNRNRTTHIVNPHTFACLISSVAVYYIRTESAARRHRDKCV